MNFAIFRKINLHPAQIALLLGDALVLQIILFFAVIIRAMFGGVSPSMYYTMSIILLLGPVFGAMLGACEIPVPPAHRELKQIFLSVTLSYLVILVFFFMTQSSVEYSRSILLIAWFGSIILVPIQRHYVRKKLCQKSWWGRPVIFLQDKQFSEELWKEIEKNPERGLRPVTCLSLDMHDITWTERVLEAQRTYYNPLFIWITPEERDQEESDFFNDLAHLCRNILVVPAGPSKIRKFWMVPRILGTTSGFLVKQNLSDGRRLKVKRFIDILFSLMALIALFPLGCFIALSIRFHSKNKKILYKQERIGQGGEKIRIFKFCSMVDNADEVLEKYLDENEDMREEWENTRKLRNDPRITPTGKWIRKTSLDELPQLINVFIGNMSFVGPRPIVQSEVERYGDVYLDYTEVKPGITGLWQVSGRNNTSYQTRVWLDRYYVTNWSVWMDIWILARTIPVVIRCEGAY